MAVIKDGGNDPGVKKGRRGGGTKGQFQTCYCLMLFVIVTVTVANEPSEPRSFNNLSFCACVAHP